VGEPSVGKTSLIQQYTLHTFDDEADATIGASFLSKNVEPRTDKFRLTYGTPQAKSDTEV
jgi:GTPase SAR1 family protein